MHNPDPKHYETHELLLDELGPQHFVRRVQEPSPHGEQGHSENTGNLYIDILR